MKRNRDAEPVALPLEMILHINQFVVEGGLITPIQLLTWHSSCKNLQELWNDRAYLETLFLKAGEKTRALFNKEKHGSLMTNYQRLGDLVLMLPMVSTIWDKIISHISINSRFHIPVAVFGEYAKLEWMTLLGSWAYSDKGVRVFRL